MGFKNKPSELFVRFFHKMIDDKKVTHKELAKSFGKYEGNPTLLLGNIESGKNGVTTENILLAEELYGLNPCSLFTKANEQVLSKAAEDGHPLYGNGNITKMLEIIAQQAATISDQQTTIATLTANKATGNRQASA